MSPLYRWMEENKAAFSAAIKNVSQPNWDRLAEEFNALGLTSASGFAINAKIARQTWWKVNNTKRKAKRQPVVQTEAPSVMPEYRAERVAPVAVDKDASEKWIRNSQSQIRRMK